MPAALADVDWGVVRATFAASGSLKEAALAHGIEEPTVRQRAKREGWQESRALILERTGKELVSRGVTKPYKAVENVLERKGNKSRLHLANAVLKGSKAASKLPGEAILAKSHQVKALAETGDKLHGWSAGTPTTALQVNVNLLGVDPSRIGTDTE